MEILRNWRRDILANDGLAKATVRTVCEKFANWIIFEHGKGTPWQ